MGKKSEAERCFAAPLAIAKRASGATPSRCRRQRSTICVALIWGRSLRRSRTAGEPVVSIAKHSARQGLHPLMRKTLLTAGR